MDDLERAILELPMEEPPEGLRASILLTTAYHHHHHRPAFSHLELAAIGTLGALALWLIISIVLGGGSLFVHTVAAIGSAFSRGFSNTAVLAWLAAGGATALWLTLFTGSQPLATAAHRSVQSDSR